MIRRWSRSVVGIVALAGAAAAPVEAGCPGSAWLDATFSYLVSNPDWGGGGGNGSCPYGFGCYAFQSDPPISRDIRGVYWALGRGNPVVGLGDDSGNFNGGFGPGEHWIKQHSYTFAYLYHYPAWISLRIGPPNVTGPPVTWSSPDADGCGPFQMAQVCTCMLLSDQWNATGYFAMLAARADALGNTLLDPLQTIRLAPVPVPQLLGHGPDPGVSKSRFDLRASVPTGGVFEKDSCAGCILGYRIRAIYLPHGAPPPVDRVAGWIEPLASSGQPQGVTPFGQTASVQFDCSDTNPHDLYFATVLAGDSGFDARFVSGQIGPIDCSCLGDLDGDGFLCLADCDESNPSRHVGALESCNGVDDDCDGLVDDDQLGEDGDGDGILSACDNCSLTFNHTQLDADFDGDGNSCDNCITTYNPAQENADLDLRGNVCDDCTDTDADGYGNPGFLANTCADDNCPSTTNPSQQDLDVDGTGDVCDACTDPDLDGFGSPGFASTVCRLDNCPEISNPTQSDDDRDAAGDSCDTCPLVWNYGQIDVDGDAIGDTCDLADGLIYVLFSTSSEVSWQAETGFTSWSVYRGDLTVLREGGPYTQLPGSNGLAERSCGLTSTSLPDSDPGPDQAAFILVTGDAGGVESSLGTTSTGAARPNTLPCP